MTLAVAPSRPSPLRAAGWALLFLATGFLLTVAFAVIFGLLGGVSLERVSGSSLAIQSASGLLGYGLLTWALGRRAIGLTWEELRWAPLSRAGRGFVVTVRHGHTDAVAAVRSRLDANPELVAWGPASVVYAIADQVVDDYAIVMRGLDVDIDEIEQQVFSGPHAVHAERIFKLKREVLDFRRAVDPLEPAMAELAAGVDLLDQRSAEYFRDVQDHVLRVSERLLSLDALLDSALNANVAQVAMRQNEDMRKISAWAAIVSVPTAIAGVYGMNFRHMPELDWLYGYPLALLLMVCVAAGPILYLKRKDWL